MSVDLYVDSEAVELNATCSPLPLFALPDSTLTLMATGYSTAGDEPGPKPPDYPDGIWIYEEPL